MKIQSIEVGISYTEVKHQLNTEIKETTIEGQVSIQHIYDYETHDSILDKSDRVVRLALVSFKIPLELLHLKNDLGVGVTIHGKQYHSGTSFLIEMPIGSMLWGFVL